MTPALTVVAGLCALRGGRAVVWVVPAQLRVRGVLSTIGVLVC